MHIGYNGDSVALQDLAFIEYPG